MATQNNVSNIPILTVGVYETLNSRVFRDYYKDTVMCGLRRNKFSSFLDVWADEDYVCSHDYKRVEEDRQCNTLRVTGGTVVVAGTTLTLAPGSHLVNGTYANVQVGYTLLTKGGKNLRITAVGGTTNAITVTVVPYGTSSVTIATDETLRIIPGVLVKEGSCDPGNSQSSVPGIERSYDMGIIRKKFSLTRTAAHSFCRDMMNFPLISQDGCTKVDCIWHKDLELHEDQFQDAVEITNVWGESITNTENLVDFRAWEGLVPQLRSKAKQSSYTKSVGWKIADVDAITHYIKREHPSCNEYGFWGGQYWRADFDKMLKDDFTGGAIVYAAFSGINCGEARDPKARSVDYGFDAVKKNGICLYVHDLDAFNDPCAGGATGWDYPYHAFGMPLCKVKCGGDMVKPIKQTFLGNSCETDDPVNRWDYGILKKDTYSGDCDAHYFNWLTERSLELVCANKWIWIEAL